MMGFSDPGGYIKKGAETLVSVLMAEALGAPQLGLVVPKEVAQLRHLPELAAIAAMCRQGEFSTARKAALLFREDDSEESYLAVRFVYGVEMPSAITAELGTCRLALVGRVNRLFDPNQAVRAVNLLAPACTREWGIRASAPTHAGKVDSPEFRAIVAEHWKVDGNNADIHLLQWLLAEAGADLYYVQPRYITAADE